MLKRLQLIPARGRKLIQEILYHISIQLQLIPVRGRKQLTISGFTTTYGDYNLSP